MTEKCSSFSSSADVLLKSGSIVFTFLSIWALYDLRCLYIIDVKLNIKPTDTNN